MTEEIPEASVGPWAVEKLECLRKYLNAYTTILRRQSHWCRGYVYLDAFAGAGRAKLRTADSGRDNDQTTFELLPSVSGDEDGRGYVDGSPRVALSIQHPFTQYTFVERSSERVRALQGLQQEYGTTRNIKILRGDANAVILGELLDGTIDWRKYRGVVFLDPFGMQVPWETIAAIAQTGALEVWINFPLGMAIQRLLPRSGTMSEARIQLLDRYFGTSEWRRIVYEEKQTLFDMQTTQKTEDAGTRLVKWYRSRLRTIFGNYPVDVPKSRLYCPNALRTLAFLTGLAP